MSALSPRLSLDKGSSSRPSPSRSVPASRSVRRPESVSVTVNPIMEVLKVWSVSCSGVMSL